MGNSKQRLDFRSKNRKLLKDIARNYNCQCAICGWHLPTLSGKGWHYQGGCDLHHIIPYRDNGGETKENLILLCPNCHKLADNDIITVDELRKHLILEPASGIEWLKDHYKRLYK